MTDPSDQFDFPEIEGYRIIAPLGDGETTWRAVQISDEREVALKLFPSDALPDPARLQHDIEGATQLQHSNIATVYASGEHEGSFFCATKYIEGRPIDKFVRRKNLSQHQILKLIRIACKGFQCAHDQGIVHRDLKPDNILVTNQGKPRVTGFGLSSAKDENASPKWLAPEQADGREDDIGPRTDLYTLGAIMYHLIVGQMPHDPSGGRDELLNRIAQNEVRRPRDLAADIDPQLEELLLKAIAANPRERFASANDMAFTIASYMEGDFEPTTTAPRATASKSRMPLVVGLCVIAVVVIIGIVIAVVMGDK